MTRWEKMGLPPRLVALCGLLWLLVAPLVMAATPCPPSLPNNPNAIAVQGGDPTGLLGYPLAVVGACPFDVSASGGDHTAVGVINGDNQNVIIDTTGSGQVTFGLSGTWTAGNLEVDLSQDGVNWTIVIGYDESVPGPGFTITPSLGVALPDLIHALCAATFKARLHSSGGFVGNLSVAARSTLASNDRSIQAWIIAAFGQAPQNPVMSTNMPCFLDIANNQTDTMIGAANVADVPISPNNRHLLTYSLESVINTVRGAPDRVRGVTTFKSATATAAGNTALWTPAAGKKFRLMRYMIEVTEDAKQAVAGDLEITLNDAGSGIGQGHSVFVPAASLTSSGTLYTSPWIDLGNGALSAAANNVLNVNLSAALTSGEVRVTCCGTEE